MHSMINLYAVKKIFSAAAIIALFLLAQTTLAQPGKPDLTFNTADDGTFTDGPGSAGIYAFGKYPSGRIAMGGGFNYYNNNDLFGNMVALNSNGSHVPGYMPRPQGRIRSITSSASGKIYIAGEFNSIVSSTQRYLARINENGSVDAGFNTGTGPSTVVFCTLEQPDGKLLVGGGFTTFNGVANNRIIRLTNTGVPDAGFVTGTGANNQVLAMGLQSDGKIIITGTFTSYNGNTCNRIARLNTDGSFDNTFNIGTGLNNPGICMQVAPDNKIYIGGLFATYNGTAADRVLRLNADGTLDNGFNSTQPALNGVETICLQADGKLVVGGGITQYNGTPVNMIFRVNTNGSIDNTFNIGTGANNTVRTIFLQSDGTLLVGGDFTYMNGQPRKYFVKLQSNGAVDNSFAPLPGANLYVNKVAIQADQKIILGGRFTSLNNTAKRYIGRMNADGSVDNSFDAGTLAEAQVYDIAIQSTGKIIFASQYTLPGPEQVCLKRLNADGTEDNTYNAGRINFSGSITKLLRLADDKIMVAGGYTNLVTASNPSLFRNALARINADGTIDAGFTLVSSPNNPVTEMAVQPDGKLIIFGGFTNIAGGKNFVRLHTDGSVDNSFNTGTGFAPGSVSDIIVQPDGKIIVGGNFTSYNGTTHNSIVRLLEDGTVDPAFATGTGFQGAVSNLLLQPDGKIILTGTIFSYQGVNFTGRAARLNTDGSRDLCYSAGIEANGSVVSIALQNINNMIMGGDFSVVNGVVKHRVVRINTGSCALPVRLLEFTARPVGKQVALQWITAAEQNSSHFSIERSFDGVNYETIGTVPAAGNSNTKQYYRFADALTGQLSDNKNIFYRLRMIDLDASAEYSKTASVKITEAVSPIQLLSNPVNDRIECWYYSAGTSPLYINVRNAAGSLVYTKVMLPVGGTNFIQIPSATFANGVYYLSITQQAISTSSRIIKIK